MITLYGINNCDTIKKARKWLSQHNIDFYFHDFKKQPLSAEKLDTWLTQIDWTVLLNKRGMMWRKLSAAEKSAMNADNARLTMLKTNSIIKRPVLELDDHLIIGFNEDEYTTLFKK
jgi:arsenate reductase